MQFNYTFILLAIDELNLLFLFLRISFFQLTLSCIFVILLWKCKQLN